MGNQLAEGPESTAHTQRIAQATHCPDKQLQKIVQQTLKCQCLKLKKRKHSSHTTHYPAMAFKHKLMSNSGFVLQVHYGTAGLNSLLKNYYQFQPKIAGVELRHTTSER